MRKRRRGRIYVKDPKNGRLYGDFRNLNGKCELLTPKGELRPTTDWDVAGILVAARVKELEEEKRGIAIVGRGREGATALYLRAYAQTPRLRGRRFECGSPLAAVPGAARSAASGIVH